MGKYRKYRRPKRAPERRSGRPLLALGVSLSILYALLAAYGYVPIGGELFDLSVDGARVVNVTLYRVAYIAPTGNRSYVVELQLGESVEDFVIPAGEEGRRAVLGESRLVRVDQEVVQPRLKVFDDGVGIPYPGPPINTSRIGRYEDFILPHYPLELYFVFTVQLCNLSVRVEPAGASVTRARLLYVDREDGEEVEKELPCAGGSCSGSLEGVCVRSYRVALDLVLFGVFKLSHENGRALLRFSENLWIPSAMFVATAASLYLVHKRSRQRTKPA